MNPTEIQTLVETASTAATTLHTMLDKALSTIEQSGAAAPFLTLARASASDLIGHLGSHLNAAPAPGAPASEAAAPPKS
jgi:hypothetical protein